MKTLLKYNEVLKVFDLRYGVLRSQTYLGRNDIFSKKNHRKEDCKKDSKVPKVPRLLQIGQVKRVLEVQYESPL